MFTYLLRRLFLLPLTLLGIVFVNFTIINLAPGDPTTITEISPEAGASRSQRQQFAFGSDRRYLQFREHYGLTLPILFNTWPFESVETVKQELEQLLHRDNYSVKEYDALRVKMGDRSRFVMAQLLAIVSNSSLAPELRQIASQFFARGGTRQAFLGAQITKEQRDYNRTISVDNSNLQEWILSPKNSEKTIAQKVSSMQEWYGRVAVRDRFEPSTSEKVSMFFFDTRFCRYLSRVLVLDFGTMRNDDNRRVIDEVTRRFKYSLTLSLLPMIITFTLCMGLGTLMAYHHRQRVDYTLNLSCLVLYAIPIFVVAPFLIEALGVSGHFPLTSIPIPYSGFTSPESAYAQMTSWQRLWDVVQHIFLPIIAITYGGLAAQSRLARTAVLEVLKQDYVRTAYAQGLSTSRIMWRHVGRNAAITIVTSIAGSLGVILGGSLIVETLFEINGFGKFFYDAVINWDYNVIMFSALAGSFLSLVGYLVADIAYTLLDPRLSLE